MISELEEHSRAMNTVNYQTIVYSRHKRPSKKQIYLVKSQGEWGAGDRKEGKRRECHIGHNFDVLQRQERRKERKKKEPVTSVTILMQPMAVAYMKLDNHAGSKGCPLSIYRTSL